MSNHKKRIEDEIDFRALLKSPVRLYGWVYILFAILLLAVGIFYVNNMSEISRNASELSIIDSLDVQREIKQTKGGTTEPIALETIYNPGNDILTLGSEVYIQNCQSCHGEEGKGDGTAGTTLDPAPRNFHTEEDWVNGREFAGMYKTLQEGIPNTGMTAYDFLPGKERIAVVHYIRNNFGNFPEVDQEQAQKMDNRYSLQKGSRKPNTIPVAKAMKIIRRENSGKVKELREYLAYYRNNKDSLGILGNIIESPEITFSMLVKSENFTDFEKFKKSLLCDPEIWGVKYNVVNYNDEKLDRIYSLLKSIKLLQSVNKKA